MRIEINKSFSLAHAILMHLSDQAITEIKEGEEV